MDEKEYKIPETYEEAVSRKQEVLKKINEYNEALLLEKELPCSEEEIEKLQEEFQILNDQLALTKEEKVRKLRETDVEVSEDGTIVEKNTIWDRINWFVYIYAFLSTLFASGFLTKKIGNSCMQKFIDNYFLKVSEADITVGGLADSDMMMGAGEFWFKFCLSYLWLPLLIVFLSAIVYFIFRKRKDINTKITFWLLILHIVLAIAVSLIVIFVGENSEFNNWNSFFQNLDSYYDMYYYFVILGYGY